MSTASQTTLPRPGPRWGETPERADGTSLVRPPPGSTWQGRWAWAWPVLSPLLPWWPRRWMLSSHHTWLDGIRAEAARLAAGADLKTEAASLRQSLRRTGLAPDELQRALALVLVAIEQSSGQRLHDTQLLAARWMLDQHFVEMATGEGKTWALAAAAMVAGMAGVPVHVITANDYLARRDALAMRHIATSLGVKVSHIEPAMDEPSRRMAYAMDIVFGTARELAFDHLRDRLAARQAKPRGQRPSPMMRGLCWAFIDEADSILLDEAGIPLVISLPVDQGAQAQALGHARRALWWQALQVARGLTVGDDVTLDPQARRARLTAQGLARVAERTRPLGGLWRRERLRNDLVTTALVALHLLQRDRDYLVRDGQIDLLDGITGRAAPGRVWPVGLQMAVSLKEQCNPGAPTETVAQITFQRFFRRYWRLSGLSATLAEARGELHDLVGVDLVRLPPRLPSLRQEGPLRVFTHPAERWEAVAARVVTLTRAGRPVLVGTDSVTDADDLSAHLARLGIAHAVLHARHDDREAEIIALAGGAGRVTVATRMAGRGTDIQLDAQARAAGGLHVINCQRNTSRRHDRQLAGRSARQGEPGSAETWICAVNSTDFPLTETPKLAGWKSSARPSLVHTRWLAWRHLLQQWMDERRQACWRRQLLEQDRMWDEQHHLARRHAGSH